MLDKIDAANNAACESLLKQGASEAHILYTTGMVRAFYRDAAVIQYTGIVDPDMNALVDSVGSIFGSVIHAASQGSKSRAIAVAQGLVNELAAALSDLIESTPYVDLQNSN